MGQYMPPFHVTTKITNLAVLISEQVGKISVLSHGMHSPHLRRANRIRTIHSSLAIEHNSLSLEQVTAILDGKRILGNPNEILEVKNAKKAYDLMLSLDPFSISDLLKAHKFMMQDLILESGCFRSGGVGIFDGNVVVHMAPPAPLVRKQMQDLFAWYQASEIHPLIRSAIFHYEFEFIHPFADGNGRMGRMWHSLLLGTCNELFFFLPVEELIRLRQKEYYAALAQSDSVADSSSFVEFMLQVILDSMKGMTEVGEAINENLTKLPSGVQKVLDVLKDDELTALEIMTRLGLSHRPAFRKNYLNPALKLHVIEMTIPDKPRSRSQRYHRVADPVGNTNQASD